jgi:hypothetical protein
MSVPHLYLVAVAAMIACAPASSPSGTSRPGADARKQNILTAEEIATVHADVTTAYDAVERLRRNWMTPQARPFIPGGEGDEYPRVFVDGRHYGALESLRNIEASQVSEIRFFSAAEAGAQFGGLEGSSRVIEVRMKPLSRA